MNSTNIMRESAVPSRYNNIRGIKSRANNQSCQLTGQATKPYIVLNSGPLIRTLADLNKHPARSLLIKRLIVIERVHSLIFEQQFLKGIKTSFACVGLFVSAPVL